MSSGMEELGVGCGLGRVDDAHRSGMVLREVFEQRGSVGTRHAPIGDHHGDLKLREQGQRL